MPFTLAHPAAVVPLRRLLPLSALVVGSLAPDFEYLFRLAAVSEFSHTLLGVLYFCIPVGLVVLWLFHAVVKRSALLLLPDFARRGLTPYSSDFPFLPTGRLAAIILALAVGALSHITWDSFTHEHGWAVERLPALRASLFALAGREVGLYKLLQHGSTLTGLALLAYCLRKRLKSEAAVMALPEPSLPARTRQRILLALLLSTCIAAVIIGLWSAARHSGLRALQVFVVQTAVGGMAAFALCLLLFSIAYRLRRRT